MPRSKRIAIIAGTGLARGLDAFLGNRETIENVRVTFGRRSGAVLHYTTGRIGGVEAIVLPRHGPTLEIPDRSPAELVAELGHEAHIWHLHELGVQGVYAFNSVGSLDLDLPLAADNVFLAPDDYARGLSSVSHSFGKLAKHVHPSMREPFDARLRANLALAAEKAGAKLLMEGLYIQSVGDAFESVAEVDTYRRVYQGRRNRVLGMTAGAELVLCRQMEIPYALICANCNWAEGLDPHNAVTHPFVLAGMQPAAATLAKIAETVLQIEAAA
ncbi:5'-methylthioadenosine phosphorylase [Burkholderia mayonis]|uniref:5'-methylthioadenosine phosphorylase n=1 Tax=Burkholderia mayonis TaxID=1385591 RepID=A0A1B4FQZ7_9BURK|nr:5'-methylthioadenosine phosphorylase [Burkholderia mayonis]AOJ06091.1 5'-methylthioadenosine phosphorylase [Burkholderia mayonis]KVE56842.1 5'-methylthioadenosine phosphorylase [Burkholderia mayonis]